MTEHSVVTATTAAQDEVADLLSELIRINTSNPTHPERPAAEWVAEKLDEVGIESQIIEAAPGRASTVARIEGTDGSRAPLLIHGHLDVVPADASEWSVDPFAGEIKDGYVWGRGAIDMKDMDAMTLALVREWARVGQATAARHRARVRLRRGGRRTAGRALPRRQPRRPLRRLHRGHQRGGRLQHLAEREGAGCTLIQTAEKGINWLRLTANGQPGPRLDGAPRQRRHPARGGGRADRLAHEWPVVVTDTVRSTVRGLNEVHRHGPRPRAAGRVAAGAGRPRPA